MTSWTTEYRVAFNRFALKVHASLKLIKFESISRRSRLLAKAAPAYSRNSPVDWKVSGRVPVSDPVEVGVDVVEELEVAPRLDGVLWVGLPTASVVAIASRGGVSVG